MRTMLLILCLVLSGCDSAKLSDIEKASKNAFSCKVHQILESECTSYDKTLEVAELRATQAGIDHERILASRQLGEKATLGDPADSPYQRVKRSLEEKPFYIKPLEENFELYTVTCPEVDLDKNKQDIVETLKALEWMLSERKFFQAIAYFQKGPELSVMFVKVAAPCRSAAYTDIEDKFPIITENQLRDFKSGAYLKKAIHPGYKSVNALVFETFEEAKEEYEKLKSDSK